MAGDAQTFAIDRTFATLSRAAPWVLAALALLFVALPFLPDSERPRNSAAIFVVSALGALFFGVLTWYGLRIARRLPYCAVSVDRDGLWPAHLDKASALVRWEQVQSIAERPFFQRLDLLDANGAVLLKLEYQLAGFDALRALLVEKLRLPAGSAVTATYAKTPLYHAFHVAGLAGFALLGWYVGMTHPLLGYGGMALLVAMILHEYLTTVSRLALFPDRLELGYPLRTREVFRTDVEAVRIGDFFNQGARHPEVGLFMRGKQKPIRLRSLGVDAVKLQQALEQWLQAGCKPAPLRRPA